MATIVMSAIYFAGSTFAILGKQAVLPVSFFIVNELCVIIAGGALFLGIRRSQTNGWNNRLRQSVLKTVLVFYILYLHLFGYTSFQIVVEPHATLLFSLIFLLSSMICLDLGKCKKKQLDARVVGTPISAREGTLNSSGKEAGRKSTAMPALILNMLSATVILLLFACSVFGGDFLKIATSIIPGITGLLAVLFIVLFGRKKEYELLLFASLFSLACHHFLQTRTW